MLKQIRFKDYLIDYLSENNITNKDFAHRIGITPKHLIDILSGDAELSLQIINNISIVTNIPVDYIYKIEANYNFEKKINDYLIKENLNISEYVNKFNYKYLIKSNFLDFTDCNDKMEVIKDILKFLRVSDPYKLLEIDKGAYYKSKNEKSELLILWLEKCYRETLKQRVNKYNKENILVLVQYISECALKGIFDEKKLVQKFNENGIYLVIQDDIPGSKIRGAFKVHRGIPAIYLTHKHKRIADIYFALLHELAHCKTDFNKAMKISFVSYDEENLIDKELKADETAYNFMVDNSYYEKVCLDSNYDVNLEKTFPKCFIVYLLARDKKIKYKSTEYQKYNFILK